MTTIRYTTNVHTIFRQRFINLCLIIFLAVCISSAFLYGQNKAANHKRTIQFKRKYTAFYIASDHKFLNEKPCCFIRSFYIRRPYFFIWLSYIRSTANDRTFQQLLILSAAITQQYFLSIIRQQLRPYVILKCTIQI